MIKQIYSLLKLVRWPNLVIVFLSQYFFAYCLIQPFQPIYPKLVFYLLSFSCIMTAASGNIINDYYDVAIDIVNKPQKVIIGKNITPSKAIYLYIVSNLIALTMAIYADYLQRSIYATTFVCVSIVLLWMYSKWFKKQFIIGNVVVALLTTAPMLLILVIEMEDYGMAPQYPVLLLYLFFSFWTCLIREILKDCEDLEGDRLYHAKTLPIVSGLPIAKSVLFTFIYLMTAVLIAVGFLLYCKQLFGLLIIVIFEVGLFLRLATIVRKSLLARDFHRASSLTKWIMLVGIGSMVLFKFFVHF